MKMIKTWWNWINFTVIDLYLLSDVRHDQRMQDQIDDRSLVTGLDLRKSPVMGPRGRRSGQVIDLRRSKRRIWRCKRSIRAASAADRPMQRRLRRK